MSEPHEVGLIVVVRRESSDIFESINGTKNLAQSRPRLRLLGPDEIQRLLGKRHLEPFQRKGGFVGKKQIPKGAIKSNIIDL